MTQVRYPITFEIAAEDVSKRLDQFLAASMPDVSRARIQEVIEQENVRVNDGQAKPSYRLRAGDRVTVLGPAERPPLRAIAEEIPLDIAYEDDDLAVVNKPAGMMVHAGAGPTESESNRGTLVNALLYRFSALSQVGGELRPGIVHRLDRETSGLIVVAKNDYAHQKLAEQFASRTVKKHYVALLHGWLSKDAGTLEAAISRDAVRRVRMTTRRSGGRDAVTHWKILRRIESIYGKFTLAEVKIDTGRTHQIRVHMAAVGHPVVGDTLYGAPREIKVQHSQISKSTARRAAGAKGRGHQSSGTADSPDNETGALTLSRNFLHAASIDFLHPRTGEKVSLSRSLPVELESFLRVLETSSAQ